MKSKESSDFLSLLIYETFMLLASLLVFELLLRFESLFMFLDSYRMAAVKFISFSELFLIYSYEFLDLIILSLSGDLCNANEFSGAFILEIGEELLSRSINFLSPGYLAGILGAGD